MTGFVLSLTCCLSLVGAIFGLVGLRRTRQPGGHRGRWAAVTAIAVGFSLTALSAGFITLGVLVDEPVEDLRVGECFDADGLQDGPDPGDVSDVEETSCQDPHDAEVLATTELTEEQAGDYDEDARGVCDGVVADAGWDPQVVRDDGRLVPILDGVTPDEGDVLVCAIAGDDPGDQFEEPYSQDE